jgi:hypothetical protein
MEPEEQVTEPDLRQKEKDEALQRRKVELESELDRYAQAGAFSPGLIKFTKWLSRALYLAMGIAFMAMLISGWGKVSKEEYDRVNDAYTKWKDEAEKQKEARAEAETRFTDAEIRAARLKLELEGQGRDPASAVNAIRAAQDLIQRAWADRADAEHGRKGFESGPHSGLAEGGAQALIRQAAAAPAAQRHELLAEVTEYGREQTTAAVLELVGDKDARVADTAWRVAGWLGGEEVKAKAEVAKGRAADFAWSQLTGAAPNGRFTPEAWVGYALRAYDAPQDELIAAYKAAPEEAKLELIALAGEATAARDAEFFRGVAISERPLPEKVVAVRWMGTRKDEGSRTLLKTLSEGNDALAAESKEAMKKLDG